MGHLQFRMKIPRFDPWSPRKIFFQKSGSVSILEMFFSFISKKIRKIVGAVTEISGCNGHTHTDKSEFIGPIRQSQINKDAMWTPER